ncbi:MAG: Flp pilus assembly protein CpaB [Caulobacteraceae bacterium]
MAVKLPAGMRAMATQVTVETGVGGFILPGDHVDVVENVKMNGGDNRGGPAQPVQSKVILRNLTVLAIDQAAEPKSGAASLVGTSATLQVPAADIDILARAREEGSLQLALRSYADMDGPQGAADAPIRPPAGALRRGPPGGRRARLSRRQGHRNEAPVMRARKSGAVLALLAVLAPGFGRAETLLTPSASPSKAASRVRAASAPAAAPASAEPGVLHVDLSTAGASARTLNLALGKSAVVDLPVDARDVLVTNPAVADAVLRSRRRISVLGVAAGETDAVFFDEAGKRILTLDIHVARIPRASPTR